MEIKLQHDVWRIELPKELVGEAGFSEGESLECRIIPGGFSLLSQGASAASAAKLFSRSEKNFVPGAKAFLLWLFSVSAGRGASALEKWKGQGTAGPAGL